MLDMMLNWKIGWKCDFGFLTHVFIPQILPIETKWFTSHAYDSSHDMLLVKYSPTPIISNNEAKEFRHRLCH